jgi:flavin reductase (DIM6/NTAB) family NADH-FMN oxidoreductase RutF
MLSVLTTFQYKVSHNPPLLSVSFSLSPRRPKDTRENILATKEFTVSIISEPFVEAANATSIEAPSDVDEWLVSGLTMEKSVGVKPAYVKESAVSMECEVRLSLFL